MRISQMERKMTMTQLRQDDSTAKDPVIESTVDELEELNFLLLDDFDDIDDDDI